MNDEPASSASGAGPAFASTENGRPAEPTAAELAERRKKNRSMFNRKRGDLMDNLLASLDLLIYAELTVIYYMDCSFFRFLVRAFPQLIFLTPKPSMFPEPATTRPYVGGIFGTNILCIIMHLVTRAPSAGEATRGYLHGGLAMDFIGEKGPTSKLHLLLLDLLVLFLQITHMTAHVQRQRLKGPMPLRTTTNATATTATATEPAPATPPPDHPSSPFQGQRVEDEERGVRRSVERERSEDIEMQTLNPPPGTGTSATPVTADASTDAPHEDEGDEEASATERLLASTAAPQPPTDAYLFDAFNSGQIVLADLDLWRSVKEQFWAYQKAAPSSPPSSLEANRIAGERLAGQVLRWRFGMRGGGRVV